MGYSVWLNIDTGGPDPAMVWDGFNYTSNCASMWDDAGAPIRDWQDKLAGDCIEPLTKAIGELYANPEKYKAMNPPNGWGSYETLIPQLENLLDGFTRNPKATIQVCR